MANMITVLRWIAVLPGAFAAMILVNTLNALTFGFVLPDFIDQCVKSWFGSMAFVGAVYYIAPKGKVVTTIVVATAYCAFGIFGVLMALRLGEAGRPVWVEITMIVISVAASVLTCLMCREIEQQKVSESLKEAGKN
jgi:phosphatidylglycerophosphate synthase